MRRFKISEFTGGWFVGDFFPAIIRTSEFELSVKKYRAGEVDAKHIHKVATEITYIAKGRVMFNDKECSEGDLVVLEPNEVNEFRSLTDSILFVAKTPSLPGDKFFV